MVIHPLCKRMKRLICKESLFLRRRANKNVGEHMGKCPCPERKLLRFLCTELKSNFHCNSTLFKTQVAAAIQLKPVG